MNRIPTNCHEQNKLKLWAHLQTEWALYYWMQWRTKHVVPLGSELPIKIL